MIQAPVLLNVELQGAVVVLLVRSLDGSTPRVRCGTREAYRVCSLHWLRNSVRWITLPMETLSPVLIYAAF